MGRSCTPAPAGTARADHDQFGDGRRVLNEDFYALGHASRFIQPGAYVWIPTRSPLGGIENVASANPDGSFVVLAINSRQKTLTFQIRSRGATVQYTLEEQRRDVQMESSLIRGTRSTPVAAVGRAPMVARARVLGITTAVLLQFVFLSPARGQERRASVWVTSADQSQLLARQPDLPFAPDPGSANLTIDVKADQSFQQVDGFGASLTESSAWLMATSLTEGERATLMTQFFHPIAGIGLNVLRQPIGASDFALSHYSYDDMPAGQRDPGLQQFSIARDRTYVIPAVKQALQLNPGVRVMASPWSAPGWMKTLGSMIRGQLKRENFAPYAAYFVKFLQAYAAEGIPIETVTVQNEPHFTAEDYPGMYMTSADQTTFVRDYLAPALAQAHLTTAILAFDQNWNEPNYPLEVFSDAGARAAIAGSAFHCYAGNPSAMTQVHAAYPEKSLHVTECSMFLERTPTFAASLIWTARNLLIGSLRNWAETVVTWNLALDAQHGPHVGGCRDCTGLATIDRGTGEVAFNGEFYALGHVSKFVQRGAHRIESTTFATQGVDDVAFRNPDGSYRPAGGEFLEKGADHRSVRRRVVQLLPGAGQHRHLHVAGWRRGAPARCQGGPGVDRGRTVQRGGGWQRLP